MNGTLNKSNFLNLRYKPKGWLEETAQQTRDYHEQAMSVCSRPMLLSLSHSCHQSLNFHAIPELPLWLNVGSMDCEEVLAPNFIADRGVRNWN